MNNERRLRLEKIQSKLEECIQELSNLHIEEQDYLDVMPENLQGSQKSEKSQTAIDSMEEAVTSLEEAISSIETAKE